MAQPDFYSTAVDIVTPVLENALVLSGHYARACGRQTILSKDMEYCMKYCAMHTVGDKIGSYFPDVYDSEDSEEEEEIEEVDEEDEEPFRPYEGSNVAMRSITEAYEAWDTWVPANPSERMLKNAIDSNEHLVG